MWRPAMNSRRSSFETSKSMPYMTMSYVKSVCGPFEIYRADTVNAIKGVAFNGWANFIDPATGRDARSCIISVYTEREAFCSINLSLVDATACFKALNGVGSSRLHSMVAVPPLIRGTREDPRFVESVQVVDRVREGTNLAAIGWEDFEHLIREIFEKEFQRSGGEVKVTRASRDGGVDAIAFDPDPIRGGKIVIQAKRYTNTVELSAVRDLYGTVVNEGAMKGILVTTSTFGPDAYAFARDKPLTLLDGGNLLHLLEGHGHRAYVDLAEAKRLNPKPLARSTGR
jgi:restriction system protein